MATALEFDDGRSPDTGFVGELLLGEREFEAKGQQPLTKHAHDTRWSSGQHERHNHLKVAYEARSGSTLAY